MNELFKLIADIVDNWLMINTDLDVEKIVDLKEFIINLKEPPKFKLKDGSYIKVDERYMPEEYKVKIEQL